MDEDGEKWYRSQQVGLRERQEKLIEIYRQLGLSDWVQFMEVRMSAFEEEQKQLNEK